MAHQGIGDESSAHIVNRQKELAINAAAVEEFMRPPMTRAQLCKKFALYQRKEYLLVEEAERLEAVFNHFAVDFDGTRFWNESSFTNFLAFALPVTTSWRLDAAPIMYRMLLQLGSYPYQTQPAGQNLSFDQMALAIQILLRRFTYFRVYTDRAGKTVTNVPMPDDIFCRLVFQSLTTSPTLPFAHNGLQNKGTDEDLLDVRKMLCEFSDRGIIDPEYPDEGYTLGAGVPKGYHFPSSFSDEKNGRLSETELSILLRMLVANKPGKPEKHDIEGEADGLLDYLVGCESRVLNGLSDGGIGWKAFSHVLAGKRSLMGEIFPAFQRIFAPCLKQDWVNTMKWLDSLAWKRERSPPE